MDRKKQNKAKQNHHHHHHNNNDSKNKKEPSSWTPLSRSEIYDIWDFLQSSAYPGLTNGNPEVFVPPEFIPCKCWEHIMLFRDIIKPSLVRGLSDPESPFSNLVLPYK